MSDVLIVYWSGTGNTEKMAELIKKGIEETGKTVTLSQVSEVKTAELSNYSAIVMGCPAMGSEVLEESEMEPFVEESLGVIQGKKLALFGSYGWGSGEWMEDWQKRMADAGADMIFGEGLIVNEEPSDEAECIKYGNEIGNAI